ncbi:nephrin-like [Diadema setosum]|uniref:nephrin-like n=1 Tax=Diadema setosum TaxID=31175 RepID=UPI003B3AAB60
MRSAKYDLVIDTVDGFHGILTVSDVTNDDEGNYTCSVVTPMGKFESTARLTVEDFCSRSVMMSPCDPVRAGAPAGLSCSAEVKSPNRVPSLLMAKDGSPVQTNRAGAEIRRGAEPLTISYDFVPLVDDHGSQITCCVQANSVCPQVCAEACVIDVQYPPSTPVVASNMSQLTFNEGMTNVRVHCRADGNPKPEDFIRWSKVGHVHEILAQSALRAGESVLEFSALSRRHAGRYRCTAANGVGLSAHTDLEILVQYAPTVVTGKKQTITVNEGQQLTLTCTAEGYPEPEISWLTTDSQPITWGVTSLTRVLDDKYKQTVVATLTFDAMVAGRDFGSRWCVASNAMGQDRMVIDIHGKQRPDPPTNLSADASHQSDSIIVTWLPTDDGEADQHFFVKHCLYPEGSPCGEVAGVTRAILILSGLQPDTCYSISVVAENDVGRSDPSNTVLVCTKAAPEVLGFTNLVVIGSGGTVLFVLLITVTLALYCRRRKRARGVMNFCSCTKCL